MERSEQINKGEERSDISTENQMKSNPLFN